MCKRSTGPKHKTRQSNTPMKTVLGCPVTNPSPCTRREAGKNDMAVWKTVLGCPVGDLSLMTTRELHERSHEITQTQMVTASGAEGDSACAKVDIINTQSLA